MSSELEKLQALDKKIKILQISLNMIVVLCTIAIISGVVSIFVSFPGDSIITVVSFSTGFVVSITGFFIDARIRSLRKYRAVMAGKQSIKDPYLEKQKKEQMETKAIIKQTTNQRRGLLISRGLRKR